MAERSPKRKYLQGRRPAEENNPAPMPKSLKFSHPVGILDPWNCRYYKRDKLAAEMVGVPDSEKKSFWLMLTRKRIRQLERYKRLSCLTTAWQRREKRPDYIPVKVRKDARSDIPDIDSKKYSVHREMSLGEFVFVIQMLIRTQDRTQIRMEKPMFVFFKNTQFPASALMSAVDKENASEDGYLHMTYSGEENAVWQSSDELESAFSTSLNIAASGSCEPKMT